MAEGLRNVTAGRDQFPPAHAIPRHRHLGAYAIVTLSGSMCQASYAGHVATRPGQLLVQPTLDCHANTSSAAGVQILRLQWPREEGLGGLYELADIDWVIRTAERDPVEASDLAFALVQGEAPLAARCDDWEDLLAARLARDPLTSLGHWAAWARLSPETLSRGFGRRYQCSPVRFRLELKMRSAWLRITRSDEPLAGIAVETGFSDQAHMTRTIRHMTGHDPGFWRGRARRRHASSRESARTVNGPRANSHRP